MSEKQFYIHVISGAPLSAALVLSAADYLGNFIPSPLMRFTHGCVIYGGIIDPPYIFFVMTCGMGLLLAIVPVVARKLEMQISLVVRGWYLALPIVLTLIWTVIVVAHRMARHA